MFRKYGCETLIVGGVEDHTHSLFALSRIHPIAQVVKEAKRTSSGWVKGTSPKFASHLIPRVETTHGLQLVNAFGV